MAAGDNSVAAYPTATKADIGRPGRRTPSPVASRNGAWTSQVLNAHLTATQAKRHRDVLVVIREGYSREGWKSLGLHRLGLRVWWIAFFGTFLITVVATAAVWATPLASVTTPPGGVLNSVVQLVIQTLILATTFALAEEIGIRGYLLPKLLPLGRKRALLLTGLVWATWHMPLIFLTPLLPIGYPVIGVPLFYAAVVAGGFFYGYLRPVSGSLWPSSIAHATHNSAWGSWSDSPPHPHLC